MIIIIIITKIQCWWCTDIAPLFVFQRREGCVLVLLSDIWRSFWCINLQSKNSDFLNICWMLMVSEESLPHTMTISFQITNMNLPNLLFLVLQFDKWVLRSYQVESQKKYRFQMIQSILNWQLESFQGCYIW